MTEPIEQVDGDAVLMALMELGKLTKTIDVKGNPVVIKALSWQEERNAADMAAKMAQQGVPEDTCQREYVKIIALIGIVSPRMDELTISELPYPVVGFISKAILEFSSGLGKN